MREEARIPKGIRTLREFRRRFPDSAACFRTLKWLHGPEPTCCHDARLYWNQDHGHWVCSKCRRRLPVTRGTIFHGSANWITTWFEAVWHLTDGGGCSARELQRTLRLPDGSPLAYQTTLAWRQRIAALMVDDEPLRGEAKLEISLLPSEKPRSGKQHLILMAFQARNLQRPDAEHWRVRLTRLGSDDPAAIREATKRLAQPGCTVETSAWPGFSQLKPEGYRHIVDAPYLSRPGQLVTEQGRRAVEQLESWLGAEMKGAVRNLEAYLKEFAFRHNAPDYYKGLFMEVLERVWSTSSD